MPNTEDTVVDLGEGESAGRVFWVLPNVQRYIVPEAARNIRERSVFKTGIRVRLIESATVATRIVSTFFDSKHIAYIIGIAFAHKCIMFTMFRMFLLTVSVHSFTLKMYFSSPRCTNRYRRT